MSKEEHSASLLKRPGFKWLLLILFACIIFSINIWSDGIYSAQEGRAAVIAQNMLESGNWLHIHIKEAHETEKPIMCYWFYALSGAVFGVNEFSVRLPSIIAALATVIMTAWLGARIYNQRTGLLAGFVLASMIGFVNLSRLARIDIVLCAFYTASMLLLYIGYFEKKKANRWLYLFYLVLALSVLVKGPVSVALVALTVVALAIKERNFKIFWELKPVSGFFIGLAVNGPWYAYEIARTHGEFAQDFFMNQNISRFTGINMTYCGGRRKTLFYYLPKLFAMALPWSILLPFGLFNFRKKLVKLRPATYYLLIWFLVVFVFFSSAAIKRGDYLLPLFAPMAILIGRYLAWIIEQKPILSKKWIFFWVGIAIAGLVAAIVVKSGLLHQLGSMAVQDKIDHISKRDGMGMMQVSDFINNMFILSCAALALALGYLFWIGRLLEKGRPQAAVNAFLLVMLLIFCVFYIWIDPSQNTLKTVKHFCKRSQSHVPVSSKVCYHNEWITEAVFFMRRDYTRTGSQDDLFDNKTQQVKHEFILMPPEDFDSMPEAFKGKVEVLEKTVPNHHYALYLVKKK
ncbi:glycosyltransferase family 39 protein [Lentisphaerota bacterium ZTH]|nr:glycosyltransferase family 39 protein [Lentisphaerota bacterium]WET05453.1 glycosyltransferase family 39 protein [Lentisphaerota bacterium ZTH]